MSRIQKFFAFFGRICISALFLYSASIKMLDWQSSETTITNLICDWHASVNNSPNVERFLEMLLPYNTFILIGAICLEVIGALLVFFGYQVRAGATLLLLYLIPVTVFAHRFWVAEPMNYEAALLQFLSNVCICGGLFSLLAFGSGFNQRQDEEPTNPFSKGL
jgi:uncharacterized membrane protein YphA (DoxX/SURF4 family)